MVLVVATLIVIMMTVMMIPDGSAVHPALAKEENNSLKMSEGGGEVAGPFSSLVYWQWMVIESVVEVHRPNGFCFD